MFSNKSQILVDFERSTNPIQDEAWTKDFLRLKGVHEMPKCILAAAVDELYYKQGSFYIRRNPYALPETLPEHDNNWISTITISSEDEDSRSSIKIQYVYLNVLAGKIEDKVEKIDVKTTESLPVPLKTGENKFQFDFVKGRMQLFVRHVRILEFVPVEFSNTDVNYIRSEEVPFIRYDRRKKRFYSTSDEELDGQSFIRSSVGAFVIQDVQPHHHESEHSTTVLLDESENPDTSKKQSRPKHRIPVPDLVPSHVHRDMQPDLDEPEHLSTVPADQLENPDTSKKQSRPKHRMPVPDLVPAHVHRDMQPDLDEPEHHSTVSADPLENSDDFKKPSRPKNRISRPDLVTLYEESW